MAQQKTIRYGVEFNVNQQNLNALKKELQDLKSLNGQNLIDLGLANNLDEAKIKLKELKSSVAELEIAFNKSFNTSLGTTNLTRFNAELQKMDLNKITANFNSMGTVGQNAFKTLTTNILTTNLQLKESNNLIDKMAQTMSNTIKWTIASSAMNTFTSSVSKAFNYVKALDGSLNDIRIVTNKSAEEMNRFAAYANKASANLGASTRDFTEAALIYYQQGLSDAESKARAEVTLKAANVTGQSTKEVSEQLTAVWNGYKVTASEAELYVDKLAAVAADTAADLEELSTGMSKVASAANLMGVDIDQLNAQLATIVSVTRQAPESVGTALKTIYARISDIKSGLDDETTLGNYTGKMASYGFSVLDATGNLRDMGEVIEEIGNKWNTLSREQQVGLSQTIAGTRQYNNLLALFDNWNMYSKAIDTSRNAMGTLQRQQDIYMESTYAHLQQLSTTAERVYKDIIDTKGLNSLVDLLTKAVSGVANYIEAIGGSGPIIMQLTAAMSTLLGPKMAQGFATTISNFKKMGENAKQVEAEIQILQQFKGLQINDSSYQKLVNMKKIIIDLNETITDEQREYANSLIQSTNELSNQRDQFLMNRDLAESFYNTVMGENGTKIDLSQMFSLGDAEKFNQQLQEKIDIYEAKIGAANKEIQKEVLQNKDADVMGSYLESAHDMLNNKILRDEKAMQDLAKAVKEYEKIAPDDNGIINEEQLEKVDAFRIAYSKAADLIIQKSNETKKIITQHANHIEESYENSLNSIESYFKSFIDKINIQFIAEKVMQINSAVMMLSSSIMSVGRIPNIWGDENLSTGEKILQTIMAITNVSQGLLSTYKLIHTTADLINGVKAKGIAEEILYGKTIEKSTKNESNQGLMVKETIEEIQEKEKANIAQGATDEIVSNKSIDDEIQEANAINTTVHMLERKNAAQAGINLGNNNFNPAEIENKDIIKYQANKKLIEYYRSLGFDVNKTSDIPSFSDVGEIKKKFGLNGTEARGLKSIFNVTRAQSTDIASGKQEKFDIKQENFLKEQMSKVLPPIKETNESLDETVEKGKKVGKVLKEEVGGNKPGSKSIFGNLKSDFSTILGGLKAIPPQAWIAVGAIAAIAGGIYLIVKAVNAEEDALNKAIEETKEATEKAKAEFEEIGNKVSEYKSARDSLNGLTEGTIEWYEAIIKANDAAQELIDLWGLIAGQDYTLGTNGLITIDEDKLNERVFKEQQNVYRNQASSYTAQANYIARSKKGGLPSLYDSFAKELNAELAKQNSSFHVDRENAKAILSGNDESFGTFTTLNNIYELNKTQFNSQENRYKEINSSIGGVQTSVETTPIKIDGVIQKYQSKYNSMFAQEEGLRLQAADQSIRGYASREDINTYNNMSSTGQNLVQQYVARNKDNNLGNWQDANVLASTIINGLIGAGGGAAAGATFLGIGAIPGAIAGLIGGAAGGFSGAKLAQAHNEKEMKKLYAQYMLGYKYEDGIWTDENGKVQKEEDILKKIDYKTAKNAYNSGDIGTRAATENVTNQLSKANTTAVNKGFNTESSNYISQAVVAANNGLDFDFGLLTKEELAEVRDQVGFTSKEIIEINQKTGEEVKRTSIDLSDSVSNAVRRAANDEANFNKELETQATSLGTTSKALKLYAKTVRDANGELLELNQTSAKLVANEYKFNKTWNESADIFESNEEAYDSWVKAVRNGGKVAYDTVDATAEVQESLEKFLGYEVSSDFMEQNYETITKLLTGTEEEAEDAYKLLQELALEEEWNKIGTSAVENSKLTMDAWLSLKTTIQELNEMEFLDDDSLASLRTYIDNAHMSYEELQQFLADNHLVVTTEAGETPDLKAIEIPGQTETRTHKISGTNPYTGKKLKEDLEWTETVSTISTPYYTLADNVQIKKDSSSFTPRSTTNFTRSAGSKDKSGNNEPDKMDPIEAEIDRYHKVNTQITKVDNSLSKLQSQQEKFLGSKLINNLNQQWELLNIQIGNYNEKLRIANDEQNELAGKLKANGVTFNADGTINNYAEAIKAQENYVNSLINKYNSMSKEQQENYRETVDKAKEDFEDFQTDLDRYDELVSDFIPGLKQEIQDALDEQIEINIQKFNMELEITLDMDQATRDWNEWAKRAIDGIDPEEILGNAQARLKDFSTYFNEAATADIQVQTRHLNDLLGELYKMDADQNNVYGNNRAKAIEELKDKYTALMQSITDVIELQDELYQAVLDEMDEVQEKFDEQISSYEFLRDLINHDMKVIELTVGEEAYGEMSKFYEAQQDNYEKQLDFQRQQKDFWYAQMQAAEEGSKEWDSAREKWESAVSSFNSILEEGLENAASKFENTINNIFKKLNNIVTGGMGLDYVETQWDLINQNADRYLDTINATYAIRELEKKYTDNINNTDMVTTQQRLKKLMDEQLASLKERERLTQYDVDRANKLYEIELARIALEEAQRNKSQMRLRRDSQGNYTYQYVADEDAISEAESKLSNLYNDLYNFDRDRYNTVLNDIYDIWNSYQQAMAEAALTNDPELRAEKERLIQEQYNELMMQAEEDYQVAKYDLQESFFWDWVDLNDMTLENFQNLTDNEKDIIMTEMVPTWENGIKLMAEAFSGPEGFARMTQDSWYEIKDAENEYAEDMKQLEVISGQTFDTIIEGEDDSIIKAEQLVKDNKELIDAYRDELTAVQNVYKEVKKLREEYEAAEKAAIAATKAAYEYAHKDDEKNAEAAKNQNQTTSSAGAGNDSTTNGSGSGSGNGNGANGGAGANADKIEGVAAAIWMDGSATSRWGTGSVRAARLAEKGVSGAQAYINAHAENGDIYRNWSKRRGELSKYYYGAFRTGGYTGDWNGDDGRMAMLHKKELVLNASDTENMLNAVAIMRTMAYSLGSSLLSRLANASANGIGAGNIAGDGTLEQNVHIDAQFPNVRNAAEIEEALNNLVNAASQRVNEK